MATRKSGAEQAEQSVRQAHGEEAAAQTALKDSRADAAQELGTLGATLQEAADRAEARGLLGVEVDPTPNSAYTVAGVLAGEPTPETDPDAAAAARRASHG